MSNNYHVKKQAVLAFFLEKRMLVSITILFAGFCIGVFISSQVLSHKENTKLTFLNPALLIIEKKDRIVDFQELRDYLTKTYENRDDYLVSVYFEYLPTGANIAVNKDEKIWPASLIKIPVAMAIMKKIQDKKWKLTNELVILDDDKDSEYGNLYKQPSGSTFTIRQFLEASLIDSDNTAHFVLLRNLDGEELEDVYVHMGLDDIIEALKRSPKNQVDADNRITAKRYSIFFRSLYNATYLNQEYAQLFLDILSHAPRDLLGQSIPETVPFVHKTGIRIDENVRADSGIVYAPGRPYIITVMIEQKKKGHLNEEEITTIFRDIGFKTYSYVTQAH
jgi:beta-lactamase class A